MNNEQLMQAYQDAYVSKEAAASDFGSISNLFEDAGKILKGDNTVFKDTSKPFKVNNPIFKVNNPIFKTEPIKNIYNNIQKKGTSIQKNGSNLLSKLKGLKPNTIGKVGLIGGGIGLIAALMAKKSQSN